MRLIVILFTELYVIKYMNWNEMKGMEEKATYVSGLEIKDNGNRGYDLTYNRKKFPNTLNLEEIGYITNPKSKAGIKKTFDSFFQIIDDGIDIEDARKEVLKQAKGLIPDITDVKVVKVEISDN